MLRIQVLFCLEVSHCQCFTVRAVVCSKCVVPKCCVQLSVRLNKPCTLLERCRADPLSVHCMSTCAVVQHVRYVLQQHDAHDQCTINAKLKSRARLIRS
jgi:hypothetical protein